MHNPQAQTPVCWLEEEGRVWGEMETSVIALTIKIKDLVRDYEEAGRTQLTCVCHMLVGI